MSTGSAEPDTEMWLLCRMPACLCALPVGQVIEIMRPLPIEPLSGMPQFIRGLCLVRGSPVPVVDAGLLLSGRETRAGRLVTIALASGTIALAVEQVIGIRSIDDAALRTLPPLMQNAAGDAVEAIRALDGELLLLLDTARLIPEALLDALSAGEAPGGSPA